MTRLILASLAVAASLSIAASGHALSEDFGVWKNNFGTTKVGPQAQSPAASNLAGKQRQLGIGMVVPAIQGIVRAPKKGPTPKTDDDCMSCAD